MDETFDEEAIIKKSNTITDFVSECDLPRSFRDYSLISLTSFNMSPDQNKTIFRIFSENMKAMYEATPSWGWSESERKSEMFKQMSRFLVLVNPDNHDDIKAFVMFRFEWDDEDEPEHPVNFCYELQIDSTLQRTGLGNFLMNCLQKISKQMRMWKTMLTCFKCNESALNFYKKIGFDVDSNSPSVCGYNDEPYEILSHPLAL